ncbi:MAG: tyrosine-type recombinase/integrase [Phycisphaerae bacterium]|nr:tyrosine-type recombinase/integrase [Phycisphaerae bacterium]
MFRTAVKRRILTENPFAGLKSTAIANKAREYFVSREEIEKILAACPDAEWRLIVSLARYGGLRMPSEMLALKWGDITDDRILVHSVKTEHFEGKAERVIPLFPELREPLRDVFEQAPAGSEFVITRYRKPNSNLRTQLTRIIHRAGLVTWPKLFQNMRASRATELAQVFPAHVVASWLGHSQMVGAKHYLQIREEDFQRAVKAPEKCAQNPAQYMSVQGGKGHQSTKPDEVENPVLLPATADYNCLQEKHLRLKGLEPLTFSSVG